jgi:hypothetical protein
MQEETINDLQSFPVLTTEVGRTGGQRSGSTNGSSLLGQTVEATLRDVLAWRPRPTDPGGFLAALNQAFSVKEVEGHTEWAWKPRSYSVQADLGQVTGAQASIYARARNALDQCVPLLEGLYPLRSDSDPQDVDAIRALIISELNEMVGELGQEGGPALQRVDTLFESLLGPAPVPSNPEEMGGLLGKLRRRFGFDRTQVNTIEEEQNLTNFLIVVEHTAALKLSFDNQRQFFIGNGSDVFLGTQLVLLSRQLAVLGESVQEAYFAMDSVFLGPAERQTLLLPLPPEEPPLTIAQLLEWVESFSNEIGPRVIRSSGKDGVIALTPTVAKLRALIDATALKSEQSSDDPPRGFYTPRSARALRELDTHLKRAETLIGQIKREPEPDINEVAPAKGPGDGELILNLTGSGFQSGLSISLRSGSKIFTAYNVKLLSATKLEAHFILSGAEPGPWAVVAVNPGGANGKKNGVYTVAQSQLPAATLKVAGLGRFIGEPGDVFETNLFGSGFRATSTVTFNSADVSATVLPQAAQDRLPDILKLQISVAPGATPKRSHTVRVTTNELTAEQPNAFTVNPKTVMSLSAFNLFPETGPAGQKLTVHLYGSGFDSDAEVLFGSTPAEAVEFKDSNHLIAEVTIPAGTAPGTELPVTVKIGGDASAPITATCDDLFKVEAPPVVLSVTEIRPGEGLQGKRGVKVNITGTGFSANAKADFGGEGVEVTDTEFKNSNHLTATLDIEDDADPDIRRVRVTNMDTNVSVLSDITFTVLELLKPTLIEFLDASGNRIAKTDDMETDEEGNYFHVYSGNVRNIRVHFNWNLRENTVSKRNVFFIVDGGNRDIVVEPLKDHPKVIQCRGTFTEGDYTLRLSGVDVTTPLAAIRNEAGEPLAGGKDVEFYFNIIGHSSKP